MLLCVWADFKPRPQDSRTLTFDPDPQDNLDKLERKQERTYPTISRALVLHLLMPNLHSVWGAFNRLWLMAAAGNLLWNIIPQLLLFLPDIHKQSIENVTDALPISSLFHRPFSEKRRLELKEEARRMFYWGYDNYMMHAFPFDELNPINCTGRGHDWKDP